MRKLSGSMVVVAVAAMAVAAIALAGSNYANGTTISGSSSDVSIAGIVTCSRSVAGPLTNLSPGATVLVHTATFTNCSPQGSSATGCNLTAGWDVRTTSTTDDNVWTGSASGVCVTVSTFLTGTCTYQGTASGGTYTNSMHMVNPAGNLPLAPGSGGACPVSGGLSGEYFVSPTDFAINTN